MTVGRLRSLLASFPDDGVVYTCRYGDIDLFAVEYVDVVGPPNEGGVGRVEIGVH